MWNLQEMAKVRQLEVEHQIGPLAPFGQAGRLLARASDNRRRHGGRTTEAA